MLQIRRFLSVIVVFGLACIFLATCGGGPEPQLCEISVSTPATSITEDQKVTIKWSSKNECSQAVRIELWRGDKKAGTINSSTNNDGSYLWTTDCFGESPGYGFRIRVVDVGTGRYGECGSFKIDPVQCQLTVTSPDSTSSWTEGETREITWNRIGSCDGTVRLELWRAGKFVHTITNSTLNNYTFDWNVSTYLREGASNYTIRVIESTTGRYGESSRFQLSQGPCSLAVTSPTSSESWTAGTNNTIRWEKSGAADQQVKLDLYKADTLLCPIVDSTGNDGAFIWETVACGEATGSNYQIRVSDLTDGSCIDLSDYFSVYVPPCSLLVTSPTILDTWYEEETRTITWKSNAGCSDSLRIELWQDNAPCKVISSSTENDGTFDWEVVSCTWEPTITFNYEIKVFDTDSDEIGGSGPFQVVATTPPFALTDASVTPGSGVDGETFSYEITFSDKSGADPLSADIALDGAIHSMQRISGDATNGIRYRYTSTLSAGSHNYRFQFRTASSSILYFPVQGYGVGPTVSESAEIVYDNSVILIDEQDSVSLSSVSGSQYTYSFTGTPPAIEVGDIVISVDTGGYLRKVSSVDQGQSQIVINTEQASMAEAFDQISFDTVLSIAFDESLYEKSRAKGYSPYLAHGVSLSEGRVNLDGLELYSGFIGGQSVDIYIDSGAITYQPTLDVRTELGPFNNEVYAAATGNIDMFVTPRIDAIGTFADTQEVLVGYIPIPLEWAAVPGEVAFSLYAGFRAQATIQGTASFNMSGSASMTVGGHYDNGIFRRVIDSSFYWQATTPEWNAQTDANIEVYLRPEISVKLFRVAGPYIDAAPYVDFESTFETNPFCTEYGVYAGFDANVGLELDVYFTSKQFSIPIYGYEKKLAGERVCEEGLPTVETTPVTLVDETSAICGGNITADGGSNIYLRGVCWATHSTPTIRDDTTFDGTGTGSFTSQIRGLIPNTTYYVRAYAENSTGIGYGSVEQFYTSSSSDSTGTVTDIDGNIYGTVKIGDQWWMAENLKVTHYRNGDPIPHVTSDWADLDTDAYCYYQNDTMYLGEYGALYNGLAIFDSRGLAPEGWHIPADSEWQVLFDFLGGPEVAGGKMKEVGLFHWDSPNEGATNESQFSALAGGYRSDSSFYLRGRWAIFASTDGLPRSLKVWYLRWADVEVRGTSMYPIPVGISVRCIKGKVP